MSYLNPLRLHFAGAFQANPPTVNNDPNHYDNANFKKEFQLPGVKGSPNGWWNPDGNGAFRLMDCRVMSAWLDGGGPADQTDRIRLCRVADSDQKVCAKMVDLDPYQQGVSEIWGLQVRICDAAGTTLVRGEFLAAGFVDIWVRALTGKATGGAMYQSVLHHLEWGDIKGSDFLQQLKNAVAGGRNLSIKFNLDGYCGDRTNAEFTRGRIVGSIGPAEAGEPDHFIAGRQFLTLGVPNPDFFQPAGKINFCAARVDRGRAKLYLDLGNALPTAVPGGALADIGALALAWNAGGTGGPTAIDNIPYTTPGWYEQTAGVVELPAARTLTAVELAAIEQNPLALVLTPAGGQPATAIAESPNGLYVRADEFIFRLNPGEMAEVRLFATRYGNAYPGARIIALFDTNFYRPSLPTASPGPPLPPGAEPIDGIEFPSLVTANDDGIATLQIRAGDPRNRRGYIDGQVYGARPVLEETIYMPGVIYPFDPSNLISLLVFDRFTPDEPPTWLGSLQPIFQQYANLYPVMARFLDLGKFDQLVAKRRLLELAFSLPITDPNHMPVTRDLSRDKREAILRWLGDVDGQDRMREGSPPSR